MTPEQFDPLAMLAALERNRVSYVIIGAFAGVIQGTDEITRGLDITPSLRPENLNRLATALADLEPAAVPTPSDRFRATAHLHSVSHFATHRRNPWTKWEGPLHCDFAA